MTNLNTRCICAPHTTWPTSNYKEFIVVSAGWCISLSIEGSKKQQKILVIYQTARPEKPAKALCPVIFIQVRTNVHIVSMPKETVAALNLPHDGTESQCAHCPSSLARGHEGDVLVVGTNNSIELNKLY